VKNYMSQGYSGSSRILTRRSLALFQRKEKRVFRCYSRGANCCMDIKSDCVPEQSYFG
jgi:hypothetical protein